MGAGCIKQAYHIWQESASARARALLADLTCLFYTIGAHVKLKTECSKPNVKIHSLGARRGHINVEYQRQVQSALSWLIR